MKHNFGKRYIWLFTHSTPPGKRFINRQWHAECSYKQEAKGASCSSPVYRPVGDVVTGFTAFRGGGLIHLLLIASFR
jgi:hypothetical protein